MQRPLLRAVFFQLVFELIVKERDTILYIHEVSLAGFEPAPTASEAGTLSIALQGRTALFYQRKALRPYSTTFSTTMVKLAAKAANAPMAAQTGSNKTPTTPTVMGISI